MSEPTVWRRSSRCSASACVEVAVDDDTVLLRDSAAPDGPRLAFDRTAWRSFVDGVKQGEFDVIR